MKSRELLKPWRNSCSLWCYDSVPTAAHVQSLMHTHTQHRANQEMLRLPQEYCGKSELPGSRSQGKDFPSLCQHLSPFAPNPNYTFMSAFTQQMFPRGQTCPCHVRYTWKYQVNNHVFLLSWSSWSGRGDRRWSKGPTSAVGSIRESCCIL